MSSTFAVRNNLVAHTDSGTRLLMHDFFVHRKSFLLNKNVLRCSFYRIFPVFDGYYKN